MVLPRHGSWRFVMDRGDTLRHGSTCSTCARKLQLRAGSYTCDSRHTRSTCVQTLYEGSWRYSSGVMDGMATSFPHLLHVANSACCLAKTRVRPGHVIFPWSIWSDLRNMNVDLAFRCQSSLVENGDWADCTWSNTFGNSTTAMFHSSECLNVAIFWRTKRLHIRIRMV